MIIVAPEPGDVITLRKIKAGNDKRMVKFRILEIDSENKEYVAEHIGDESAHGSDDVDGREERATFSKLSKLVQKSGDIRITKESTLVE